MSEIKAEGQACINMQFARAKHLAELHIDARLTPVIGGIQGPTRKPVQLAE